jgi:hypothetical protein
MVATIAPGPASIGVPSGTNATFVLLPSFTVILVFPVSKFKRYKQNNKCTSSLKSFKGNIEVTQELRDQREQKVKSREVRLRQLALPIFCEL